LIVLALLFTSCKKSEVEVASSDSSTITVSKDTSTIKARDSSNALPSEPATRDTLQSKVESGEQLLPVDEAAQDPSFLKYRQQLLAAVSSRSASQLMPLLDSNIRLSFGGSGGLPDFRRSWRPQDQKSPLWDKLGWILAHGGSFRAQGESKSFWAPYVYSKWPDDGPEPFEYAVATEPSVEVYAKPDTTSPVMAILHYHFVRSLDGGHLREKQPLFVKIQTPSGKVGFVRSSQVRSQLDYRAGFNKIAGKWRMTTLIAGD
jgi:hypothetical protein